MPVNVLIELQTPPADAGATLRGAGAAALPQATLAGATLDPSFGIVQLPALTPASRAAFDPSMTAAPVEVSLAAEDSTWLVRGVVDEEAIAALEADPAVLGVFSDPQIQPCTPVCPGGAPRGDTAAVAAALCTKDLAAAGATGAGVLLAIVDTGINLAHLQSKGLNPATDAARSWVPDAGMTPFAMPVDHGTMCAYDALIAAPMATLVDVAVLSSTATGPTIMSGVLSDAIRAYRHLIGVMTAPRRPGDTRSMVVSNSWGMFHPSWDFPVGESGNYSDNPNHPFNRIVAQLEAAGADILFAAGNCGADCADGRCEGVTDAGVYGANSSPSVLCVAGVDVHRERAGYSTQGPGRLARNKPDICGYTHFLGSGVYAADGGTSAATPVVAGVLAAVRTVRPYSAGVGSRTPAAMRTLLTSTAVDLGASGFDFDHGFGVVDGCTLAERLSPFRIEVPFDICKYVPELCTPHIDLCKRYPWICEGVQEIDLFPHIDPRVVKGFVDFAREVHRLHEAGPKVAPTVGAEAGQGSGGGLGGGCC